MFSRIGAMAVCCSAIVACARLPSLEPGYSAPVSSIVDRIQCELKQAVLTYEPQYPWIKGGSAEFNLFLQVDEAAGISPNVAFISPYGSGTFTGGLAATVSGTASRTATLAFNVGFERIKTFKCPQKTADGVALNSDLGISDWMGQVLGAVDTHDAFERVDSFGQTIQFLLIRSASASPQFSFERFRGPSGVNPPFLSGSRTDTHKLVIAITGPKPNAARRLERSINTQQLNTLSPLMLPLR